MCLLQTQSSKRGHRDMDRKLWSEFLALDADCLSLYFLFI